MVRDSRTQMNMPAVKQEQKPAVKKEAEPPVKKEKKKRGRKSYQDILSERGRSKHPANTMVIVLIYFVLTD